MARVRPKPRMGEVKYVWWRRKERLVAPGGWSMDVRNIPCLFDAFRTRGGHGPALVLAWLMDRCIAKTQKGEVGVVEILEHTALEETGMTTEAFRRCMVILFKLGVASCCFKKAPTMIGEVEVLEITLSEAGLRGFLGTHYGMNLERQQPKK